MEQKMIKLTIELPKILKNIIQNNSNKLKNI
jgi:hypothetical protein